MLWFTRVPEQIAWISMIKGWFYVGVTALLLFILVWKQLSAQRALHVKLENRQQELNEFLYAMSHHLRSPLVNIDGFARELLLFQPGGDIERRSYRKFLEQIQRSALQMDHIIKNLARLHRTLRTNPQPQKIPVEETLRQVLDLVRQHYPLKPVQLKVKGKAYVWADRSQFELMMGEIFTNAVQHGWQTPELMIQVNLYRRIRTCVIEIQDKGSGFSMQRVEDLVQPVMGIPTNHHEDLRVGLAIAWRCARWNDGSLDIQSAPGQGTLVKIVLPRA